MPEITTQVEIKDTRRNVYTQCGVQGGVMTSVISEYKTMKKINARPRVLTNPKSKQPRKPGMKVSEVNTEKIKTHRKCVGTDDIVIETKEEPEIMILKEINHLTRNRVQRQATTNEGRKRNWSQARPSRQEKLYADILAAQTKKMKRTEEKENENEDRDKQRMNAREKRKVVVRKGNQEWIKKFREWSPTQEWPLTREWERSSRSQEQQKIASNREIYLRLKF